MDMPGVEEKDVDVSLDNGVLKITGKKEHEKETKDAKVHRIERSYGSFKKTIQLPDNVLKDKGLYCISSWWHKKYHNHVNPRIIFEKMTQL